MCRMASIEYKQSGDYLKTPTIRGVDRNICAGCLLDKKYVMYNSTSIACWKGACSRGISGDRMTLAD
jgi:hypothetical protein